MLDFEDIPAGTTINTQYAGRGVQFQNHYLDTDPAASSGSRVLRTVNPGVEIFTPIPLVMTFGSAPARVTLRASTRSTGLDGTLTAFDTDGNVVATDGPKPVAANVFTTQFEVTGSSGRIVRAELRLANAAHFAIDDLEFDTIASPGCPLPRIVEIREADPQGDRTHHDVMRSVLLTEVAVPNTTIVLGPNVVLDFTDAKDQLPLDFGSCVTLTSASSFPAESTSPPARSPSSLGPLLKMGLTPQEWLAGFFGINSPDKTFMQIRCIAGFAPNDHVRISGFRVHGPDFGQQRREDIGIQISRCLDIEVSNMEIAGWGGNGIQVLDEGDAEGQPADGPGQVPPNNFPGERIGSAEQVRILRNHIHHNQHPRTVLDGHTAGYGVLVTHGAWAQVYENLFDFNRHAIAAAGDTGGYEARRNLVLKGGGVHFGPFRTHQFDIHGTGGNGFGGRAGVQFDYAGNAFQYRAGPAIEVRGRPQERVDIHDNVFPHPGLEDDRGDDAVHVEDRDDLDVIHLGPNNVIGFDSYGHYEVCDFDGDGVDDLFLATGQTWWFSSGGEFPWTYLSARTERLDQVRLGYFDADGRCDVLTEHDGEWVIASGGTGPWQSIGAFGAPLSEVVFGRFDPRFRDHRPGVTRQTTEAFWRSASGQWLISPLTGPAWEAAQSSSIPLSQLRFGDFTGDGVTDVLAVQGGRWSISESGTGPWQRLNPSLSDDVRALLIADLDHNNIDDLIRVEVRPGRVTWWVSYDGRSPWRRLTSFSLSPLVGGPSPLAFAGRFGTAPGGGVLFVDMNRNGHFYSEAEIAAGASPQWQSLFAY